MLARLLRPVRRLRAARARWSVAEDRVFHDGLFQSQGHNPFSPSYVGYVTIQRFAELASAYLSGHEHVLDLGCGPGEITCELGRRFPRAEFLGIDHSASAIARARDNAARLALQNVRFEQADVATFVPPRRPAVVMMFDAFHHLVEPRAFVRRMSEFADRFFLIEPAGDALGRWRRTLDFDWLPCELDKIRARLEHQLGERREQSPARATTEEAATGRAVEHRYPLGDYEEFFPGFSVEARGTVAGFDVYPPNPEYDSAWRREMVSVAHRLLSEVDDALLRSGQDCYAKHWAIYATKHPAELRLVSRARQVARPVIEHAPATVAGPYDATYEGMEKSLELAADVNAVVDVGVANRSWRTWSSDSVPPIHLSHHWLGPRREPVIYDGLRTRLPGALLPGASARVAMTVHTPGRPGQYLARGRPGGRGRDLVQRRWRASPANGRARPVEGWRAGHDGPPCRVTHGRRHSRDSTRYCSNLPSGIS